MLGYAPLSPSGLRVTRRRDRAVGGLIGCFTEAPTVDRYQFLIQRSCCVVGGAGVGLAQRSTVTFDPVFGSFWFAVE